jgi:hypothetical protein
MRAIVAQVAGGGSGRAARTPSADRPGQQHDAARARRQPARHLLARQEHRERQAGQRNQPKSLNLVSRPVMRG